MNSEEAVLYLRRQKAFRQLIDDAYLSANLNENGESFRQSAEFTEARRLLGPASRGTVLDMGSGTGIAAYAFARSGARQVIALEPDMSAVVGAGAIRQLTAGLPVKIVAALGESIPLPGQSVDAVYARQVLHHTQDLKQAMKECARVLRPGGRFLACREHVVDNAAQLAQFLEQHPIHRLTGGEHAYSLAAYLEAIEDSGLRLRRALGPWDSLINAFPGVRNQHELEQYPSLLLQRQFGWIGAWLGVLPLTHRLVWQRLKRPLPGRLYSFVAVKS